MIRRELGTFLIVGSLTVLVDFLMYRGVAWTGLLGVDAAKAVGFLTGTLFAYFANRLWTFRDKKHAGGSVRRFAALYAMTLAVNVAINSIALAGLDGSAAAVQISFLTATIISAALNFFGLKFYVFTTSTISEPK